MPVEVLTYLERLHSGDDWAQLRGRYAARLSMSRFRSSDGKFGLQLDRRYMEQILTLCEAAGAFETGGLLVGKYTARHDTAFVTKVVAAPPDSRAGNTWFYRGVKGVKEILTEEWAEHGSYYLGEWHFHPHATPTPSPTDRKQMRSHRLKRAFGCPEPVLLIIGGDPRGVWQTRAFVYPSECDEVALEESVKNVQRT